MPNIPCTHCGQLNENQRDICWACCKLLKPQEAPAAKFDIPGSVPAPPREQLTAGPFHITRTKTTKITINGKEFERLEDVPEQFWSLIDNSIAHARQGKRSRIVVNGKEYERLEDVPEPFRSKLKDRIGRAIPGIAKSLNREEAAWKMPSISFSFGSPSEPLDLDPDVPVAPPDGFRFEDTGLERLISWRWISWRTLGATLFIALWDGVMTLMLYAIYSSKAAFKDSAVWVPLALMALAAAGISMTYAAAAFLVNRTSIRIRCARVSVRHGPLPWFGEKDVPRADIDRVWSEKIGRATDEDAAFVPAVSYGVKLLLKGDRTLPLVRGLLAPEQALFIEQQIRMS